MVAPAPAALSAAGAAVSCARALNVIEPAAMAAAAKYFMCVFI
jgi:hypothetical protein